jgi:hypothetical protein
MRTFFRHGGRTDVLAIVILAALAFRAYVPVGFMPASGTPFLVELCPDAGAMPAPHLHHHHPGHADFQHCPFGSSPAPGPASQLIVFQSPEPVPSVLGLPADTQRSGTRLPRAQQARGPPSPA